LANPVTPRYKDPARIEAENNLRIEMEKAAALANHPDYQMLEEKDRLIEQVKGYRVMMVMMMMVSIIVIYSHRRPHSKYYYLSGLNISSTTSTARTETCLPTTATPSYYHFTHNYSTTFHGVPTTHPSIGSP